MGAVLEVVEDIFFQDPLVTEDPKHSTADEKRYVLVCLASEKPVFAAFTIRNNKVRVVSARYMHHKEAKKYENR